MKSSGIFYVVALVVGAAIGAGCTYAYLSASVINMSWNASECVTSPNNPRDGLRISAMDPAPDSGPTTAVATASATGTSDGPGAELVANYVSHSGAPNPENCIRGGNINRCALLAILKSLDETDTYVHYNFGMDRDTTILILKGGFMNPDNPGTRMIQRLTYRTGTYAECFCPIHCQD